MSRSPASSKLGSLLLIAGTVAFLVLAIPEWRAALPGRLFQNAIPLWLALTLATLGVGLRLLWQADYGEDLNLAGNKELRFHTVVVYTRDNCPLCEEAIALLDQYSRFLPEIKLVDISRDSELTRQHGTSIPVVEIDGRIRFRGRVSEPLLRRMIRMAVPIR